MYLTNIETNLLVFLQYRKEDIVEMIIEKYVEMDNQDQTGNVKIIEPFSFLAVMNKVPNFSIF